jgi:hypothetical protein
MGNMTEQTIDLIKKAHQRSDEQIAKSITTATGLTAYDLQAPAKNLYPVNTPIRNKIPRVGGGVGTATNWKEITAITGSGYDAMGWVAEGQRTARMSYTTAPRAASYKTLGEEDSATFEAIAAGRTFEDIKARMIMRLLQKAMLKEENASLGGNFDVALGTPATPTLAAAGSGATLPAATYSVIVVALTYEGYRNSSLANGVATSQSITGADGDSYTLNGGSSNKSTAATQAVTLGQTLSASVTPKRGAVGYAWYVGTAGNEKLEAITTINSATFSAPLAGTGQAATAITTDCSTNSLAFNGLLYSAFKSDSNAYINTLATGTAGTGTVLTASGSGSITQIDTMFETMWNTYQVSPDVIYVNSQELKNITKKVLQDASGGALVRFSQDFGNGTANVQAGAIVGSYFNPYTANGGMTIPIRLHPTLTAGTILAPCENLPAQYQSTEVPEVAEMKIRTDYYEIDWPKRSRKEEVGVYVEEVLAVYAPFALGIINNIANG